LICRWPSHQPPAEPLKSLPYLVSGAFFLILKGFKTTTLDRREASLLTQAAAVAA